MYPYKNKSTGQCTTQKVYDCFYLYYKILMSSNAVLSLGDRED